MPNINPGEPAYHAHVAKDEHAPQSPTHEKSHVNEAKLSAYEEHEAQAATQVK